MALKTAVRSRRGHSLECALPQTAKGADHAALDQAAGTPVNDLEPERRFELRRLLAADMALLAAVRLATVVALGGLGMTLLALLGDAQRGPHRALQVSIAAWEPAVATGFACVAPLACLAGFVECLLPMLAPMRLRPATLLLVGCGVLTAVGAWAAWRILGLEHELPRAKQFALTGAAALLFLLIGSLQTALWLAAHRPGPEELQTLPFAWHVTFAVLAALTLGGRWGWAALEPQYRFALERRAERWRTPEAPPLQGREAPEAWTQ